MECSVWHNLETRIKSQNDVYTEIQSIIYTYKLLNVKVAIIRYIDKIKQTKYLFKIDTKRSSRCFNTFDKVMWYPVFKRFISWNGIDAHNGHAAWFTRNEIPGRNVKRFSSVYKISSFHHFLKQTYLKWLRCQSFRMAISSNYVSSI